MQKDVGRLNVEVQVPTLFHLQKSLGNLVSEQQQFIQLPPSIHAALKAAVRIEGHDNDVRA